MSEEWTKVAASATVSNIGVDFDTFRLAIHESYDIIEGRKIPRGVVISKVDGLSAESIMRGLEQNSITIASSKGLRRSKMDFGVEVKSQRHPPLFWYRFFWH